MMSINSVPTDESQILTIVGKISFLSSLSIQSPMGEVRLMKVITAMSQDMSCIPLSPASELLRYCTSLNENYSFPKESILTPLAAKELHAVASLRPEA
jgi:hypothetical protein